MIDLTKVVGVRRLPDWKTSISFRSSIGVPFSDWTKYTIVTDNQHNLPACAGFATANWIECMLRKYQGHDVFERGQQIDGEAIWRKARQMFWSHEPIEDGGLYMDQGFRAAVALGILPPDTGVIVREMDIGQLCNSLREHPVLQGTSVFSGWNHPSSINGQIPISNMDSQGGHATCIIGCIVQDGKYYILFQNSWGSSWGYGGYGLLTANQWSDSLIGPLSTAILSPSFYTWTGWKNFIK